MMLLQSRFCTALIFKTKFQKSKFNSLKKLIKLQMKEKNWMGIDFQEAIKSCKLAAQMTKAIYT